MIMRSTPPENCGGVVKMEDLVRDGVGSFAKGLGLPDNDIKMPLTHKTQRYQIPHWTKWNRDLTVISRRIMGKELRYFGYEDKKSKS